MITMPPEQLEHLTKSSRYMTGRRAERAAHIELFDEQGARQLSCDVGLRTHGGADARSKRFHKKSFRVYFREDYGRRRLGIPLFDGREGDERRMVLRAGYGDVIRFPSHHYTPRASYIRDQVVRDLHADMGAKTIQGTWALLYLNLEPTGLYSITQRMSEDLLEDLLGKGDYDIIGSFAELVRGSRDHWTALESYVQAHDLAEPENAGQVLDWIDVDSFTSYMILNMWVQNSDWPNNNWYAARRQGQGNRWQFFCWDAEESMGLDPPVHDADPFELMRAEHGFLAELLFRLLQDDGYRQHFTAEVRRHLAGALAPRNVVRRIDEHAAAIRAAVPFELAVQRVGFTPKHWEANIERLRYFARNRGPVFLQHLQNELSR